MQLLRFIAVALLAASPAVLFCTAAAGPLDKTVCADLENERQKLLTAKMRAALEQGPDWVKDNLNPEDIEKVRQFLLVEEKLMFRCRDGGGVARALQQALTNPDGVSLPDRKPTPPDTLAAAAPAAPAETGDETGVPLPDRNPNAARTTAANVTSSQTVADSDKTAPSNAKATR